MLAVESLAENSQWEKAHSQLQSLTVLKTNLPDEFYFYNGLVSAEQGDSAEATASLKHYVVEAGKTGKHYIEALKLITTLDDRMQQNRSASHINDKAEVAPIIVGADRDGYIRSLQALFLTDDPVKALVMQVNSLLSAHGYTGSRLKKAQDQIGTLYVVSVSGEDLIVQEKSYNKGIPVLTMSKLNVSGVDPYLRHDCASTEFACWIIHPGNKRSRWLVIDRDEMVIRELSSALSKLILTLQQMETVQH